MAIIREINGEEIKIETNDGVFLTHFKENFTTEPHIGENVTMHVDGTICNIPTNNETKFSRTFYIIIFIIFGIFTAFMNLEEIFGAIIEQITNIIGG